MKELKQIIAENIVFLRKKSKLTQLEFGEKFNYTDKTVSRWENGTVAPDVETLKAIADFYGVSMDYLVTEHKSAKEFNSVVSKVVNPRNNIILIALIVTVIWCIAMTIYIASIYNLKTADMVENRWWSVFLWSVPISFALMAILTYRWFKSIKWTIIFVSCFIWTILLSAFFTFLFEGTYWYLFFIGLPIQVALILFLKFKEE